MNVAPVAPAPEPSGAPAAIVSVKPVSLPAPERGDDLQVRVSAPVTGRELPVIVFSHGFGWSLDGYAPLTDQWAARGFVVVQPTHLDSRKLALAADDPRRPSIWRQRVLDLAQIIGQVQTILTAVPGLSERVDSERIGVAGHSWGAHTASMLLGSRILDADGVAGERFTDARVKAGVLLAMAGEGGENLTPFAAENFPHLNPTFAEMSTPALIVAGDRDDSPLSVRGPEWLTDGYHLSPGEKSLLWVFGAEHSLGGIPGDEVRETTDESPERVAFLGEFTAAYLHTALTPGDTSWTTACAALAENPNPLGRLHQNDAPATADRRH